MDTTSWCALAAAISIVIFLVWVWHGRERPRDAAQRIWEPTDSSSPSDYATAASIGADRLQARPAEVPEFAMTADETLRSTDDLR